MSENDDWLYEARRELYRRFPVAAVAFSADGQLVQWAGPLDLGIETGEIAVAQQDDAELVVFQVRDAHIVEHSGELTVRLDDEVAGDLGSSARVTPRLRAVSGTGFVLGYLGVDGFEQVDRTSAAASPPFGELPVRRVTDDELTAVAAGLDDGQATIEMGVHRQADAVTARLRSKGFGRHTFMCGQSGSGKTYTTGVLFERLLADTGLPLVVIDPNSDHVHLGALADPDDSSPLGDRYRELVGSVKVAAVRGHGAEYTLCVDFSDLDLRVQALLLRLHPIDQLDDFAQLRQLTGSLSAPYSIGDVARAAHANPASRGLALRIENLGLSSWDLWCRPGEGSLVREHPEGLPRCLVLDVGSFARPEERNLVSLVLLSNRWARRRERTPVLLAIDEAHNVFPAASADPLLQETAALGALIAGEGRKFGLHLFVATQRPGKVHANVVSQCDNLILMRMNGAGDIAELESLFSHVPPSLLRGSNSFGLGQALFAGPISPVPLLAQVGRRVTKEGGGDVPASWV